MIFNYLEYVIPAWYYHLIPKKDHGYFPLLSEKEATSLGLEPDPKYRSEEARKRDLAWRAFHVGWMDATGNHPTLDIWEKVKLPAVDEYRFLRKHFHRVWVLYVLMLRLFSFKNPFAEIGGYLNSRGTVRWKAEQHTVPQPDLTQFQSPLMAQQPLITVVIPTLNRYEYLKDVLADLGKQTYKNFEIRVIDQSEPFRPDFYEGWQLNLKPFHQEEKALWLARNNGITQAEGKYIALTEDDVRIKPDWLEMHLKCVDYFNSRVSCGVFYPVGGSVPASRNFFKYGEQFATGNALIERSVYAETGLFDRQFERQRMGDGEYGQRAYLHGIKLVSNPLASCVDVKASVGGLRQMGSWDAFRPKSFWSPRPIPSVLYFFRKYHGNRAARLILLKNVPPSVMPYRFKQNKPMLLLGALISVLLLPIVLWQVAKSWGRASEMLKEASKMGTITK